MKLENQVCSLKLAKKLRKLGVKQDSLWEWVALPPQEDPPSKSDYILTLSFSKTLKAEKWCFSAFTVAELGGMLPVVIDLWGEEANIIISKGKFSKDYCIDYLGNNKEIKKSDKNLSNALAKMLVYLLEVKLLKIKKGGKHGITQI